MILVVLILFHEIKLLKSGILGGMLSIHRTFAWLIPVFPTSSWKVNVKLPFVSKRYRPVLRLITVLLNPVMLARTLPPVHCPLDG